MNYAITNDKYKTEIKDVLKTSDKTNEIMPIMTIVQATIRIVPEDHIWVKLYPYPRAGNEFINHAILKLLDNQIIQHS